MWWFYLKKLSWENQVTLKKKVRHKNNKEKYRTLHCHLAQIPCSALHTKDSDIKNR